MLPVAHRLTEGDGFRRAVRSGRRAGGRTLVVHVSVESGGDDSPSTTRSLVGFVVSKAVGNAVVRNRVKRRLRHLCRDELGRLESVPGRVVVVVRALPAAAGASYAELGADLGRCLQRCLRSVADPAIPTPSTGEPTTVRTP
ncbi:MAG TPA: ribonuclease P protein component [Nocardioides sp.]